MSIKNPAAVAFLPLKELDGAMLTLALHQEISTFDAHDRKMVDEALLLAAYLHRKDTRQSPTVSQHGTNNQPTNPYIEHPLRNAVRLARWGVRDANIIVAALLHDVVEDHVFEIVEECTDRSIDGLGELEAREYAYSYLVDVFNKEVMEMVKAVSNPIFDLKTSTRAERDVWYAEHVTEAVLKDPKVYLVKFTDFADNALSLHHNILDKLTIKRARKYFPLVAVFEEGLNTFNFEEFLSPRGEENIVQRVDLAHAYLLKIIESA